jgi:hypothetical protein
MTRAVRFPLAAGALLLVCACKSDSLNQPIGRPWASFSDGAHSGNPDFFFLPPLFKIPNADPNFEATEFNGNLRPTVEICALTPVALVPPGTLRGCATTVRTFAASEVRLSLTDQLYQVNWDTSQPALSLTIDYRIRVLLGSQELGYADVDAVVTGGQLKRVDTGEFIGLVDGRTLPIKFRIENGAACNGGACNSKTIDLAQGGFVVFTATGDRVDIPRQQSGQAVTVTVQQCADLDIDLPVFGNCLRVTADPPLAARLAPAATVSICSLNPLSLPLAHAQQDLLTLHRQDDRLVIALPHSDDFCETPIGQSESGALPRNFAARGWRALRNAAAWIFRPAQLHASSMVLDVGQGGQTDGFSDFQFALPAKMDVASLIDQVTSPNGAVPSAPSVFVTDADGNPVANARVHFQITSTGGGSIMPTAGMVLSDGSGHATLTQWLVGAAGAHSLQAYGKGIADPRNNGPAAGFDPFAPAVLHNPEEDEAQPPVTLGTGRLTFRATAGAADFIIESLTSPVEPTTDDALIAGATVTNAGSANGAPATVNLCLVQFTDGGSSSTCYQPETPTLAAGQSATFTQNFGTFPAGTWHVYASVDTFEVVPESNETNNSALGPAFTITLAAISFETFTDGSPTCASCALTDAFGGRGVVFSFSPIAETGECAGYSNAQLFLSSSVYDPAGGPPNHSATAAGLADGGFCSGLVTMTFDGSPGTVRFRLRGPNGLAYPVDAFDAAGNLIPESQIVRSDGSAYTSVAGHGFLQETVTITNAGGVSRVALDMNGFIVLIDNLLILP